MDGNQFGTCLSSDKKRMKNKRGLISASYLLFSPELVEHVLDLQLPVILQRVEGLLRHLLPHLLLQGRELGQDGAEVGSAVGVLVPALCLTHTHIMTK